MVVTLRIADVARRNLEMVRERCVMEGLEQAVERKKRTRERSGKLDGEAQLIQLACSDAPEGQARWTLRQLADRLVELEVVESISRECVRQALKDLLKPWKKDMWCISRPGDAAFVYQMEQVLDVYQQPHDSDYPLVCMDETTKQCTLEVRAPVAAKPGRTQKYDGEYERNGVGHLMMLYAPPENWRRVQIADNHKAPEWAEGVRKLVQGDFPEAKCILW